MFENWYDEAYLKMIYPRTASEDIKIHSGASFSEYIEIANDELSRYINKINSIQRSRLSSGNNPSFQSLIELFGQLKSGLLKKLMSADEIDRAVKLIDTFEEEIRCESTKIKLFLQEETNEVASERLTIWQDFVMKRVNSQELNSFWSTWYDVETEQLISPEDVAEDYTYFLSYINGKSNFKKAWDIYDYRVPLIQRERLASTFQLSKEYCQIECYEEKLKVLDDQLKNFLVEYDGVLPEDMRKYYPKSYYWWYYGILRDVYLWD